MRPSSLHSSKSPFLLPRSLTPSHKFSLFPSLPSFLPLPSLLVCQLNPFVHRRSFGEIFIVRPRPPRPPSTPQITTPAAMALIFPPHSYWPRNTWWLRSSSPFATEFPRRVSSLDLESRSRERVVAVGCSLSSPRLPYFNLNERFVG